MRKPNARKDNESDTSLLKKENKHLSRQLEIETSLERVRARAIEMNHSDELSEVLSLLFKQFDVLGISPVYTFLSLIDLDKNKFTYRQTGKGGKRVIAQQVIDLDSMAEWKELFEGMKLGRVEPINCLYYPKESFDKVWEVFAEIYAALPEGSKVYPEDFPNGVYTTQAYCKFGYLGFDHTRTATKEEKEILLRFAKEFERLYRRFLDLKKAEAQAREAQIEAALERVRSRSMAMHKSEELGELSFELVKQVASLGIDTWHCAFNIYDEGQESSTEWGSNAGGSYPIYKTPREGIFLRYYEIGQKGETLHVEEIGEDRCADHYAYLCTLPGVGEQLLRIRDAGISFPKSQVDHVAYFKYGYVLFITFERVPEAHDVFKRFAKVFEQTYTRFLDLQKAEAQAREAQIEASLERVRSSMMAMHHTDDLKQIIGVVFNELTHLELQLTRVAIWIFDKETFSARIWIANPEIDSSPKGFLLPTNEFPPYLGVLNAWKNKEELWQYLVIGEAKKEWENYLFAETDFSKFIPQEIKEAIVATPHYTFHASLHDFGCLHSTVEKPLSTEQLALYKRFGRVFDQAYKRFLDLQKAEAQAREAQIEAALERVRSRTMAMQHSSELGETSFLLVKQVLGLNIKTWGCAFNIFDPDEPSSTEWFSTEQGYKSTYKIPREGVFLKYYDAAQKGKSLHVEEFLGDACLEHYKYLSTLPGLADEMRFYAENSVPLPTSQYDNVAFTKYGYLLFVTYEDVPDSHDIFIRFAKVFEQTYTRFLDLQRAEDQAREARIETALERVRSRSMAMHRSEELLQVITVVSDQLQNLNFKFNTVSFATVNQEYDYKFWFAAMGNPTPLYIQVPYVDNPMFSRFKEVLASRATFYSDTLTPEESRHWHEHVFKHADFSFLTEETKAYILRSGYARSVAITPSIMLIVSNYAGRPFSDDQNDIIKRFAVVFEQSYTRFLDLQKAEAQAREAQIEAALEKVRSRSLVMKESTEIKDVITVVLDKLYQLGLAVEKRSFVIFEFEPGYRVVTQWVASPLHPDAIGVLTPYFDNPIMTDFWEAREKGIGFYENPYPKEVKDSLFSHFFDCLGMKTAEESLKFIFESQSYSLAVAYEENSAIGIATHTGQLLAQDEIELLRRFGRVYEQSYTRFLDLQKAETQAREANIESGLERVRSRAMAMQTSEELNSLIGTVFTELTKLDLVLTRCVIMTYDHKTNDARWWMTNSEAPERPMNFYVKYHEHPPNLAYFSAWRERRLKWVYSLEGTIKKEWDDFLFSETELRLLPDLVIAGMRAPDRVYLNASFYNSGNLTLASLEPLSDEHFDILIRFAKVFDLTYTRFNDLKQAEAQAREAQIEASLERVRSKTMAMHNSHDVGDTVATLFDELTKLGVKTNRCGILIFSNSNDTEIWAARSNPSGEANLIIGYLDASLHPLLSSSRNAWKSKENSFSYVLVGEDLINYYQMINNQASYPMRINMEALPSKEIHTEFYFPDGAVFAFTHEPIATDDAQIFKRLAGVFGQTYRRYLDLKKAEAQAREATIEASLERVRAKAMAMHSTADLTATVSTIFIELRSLGIKPLRLGLGIINRDTRNGALYSATISDDGSGSIQLVGSVVLDHHPVLEHIYESWIKKSDYFPVLSGELLKSYYQILRSGFQIPDWHAGYEQYGQFYPFEEGTLYAWSEKPIAQTEIPIFKRFTSVLALTYKRYNELQLSEANAREAVRRASIDRVRAEIASMRTTNDLERITPLIWNELTELGVPFIRCGVFIMDEAQEIIHTFLSTPDGKAIAAFHLPYTTPGNIQMALSHWKKNERYIEHWTEDVFREFADILVKQGALTAPDQYLSTLPHGGFYLHFLPFLQGMLYVGNTEQLTDDQMQLIQTVADAFSTAYARYEDFNKLEAAKQQVDKTLSDLKKTQNQLVISEKMASLGELTAGIAHEIQNPLNFVNNFSEVSNELLNELNEEIQKGNFAEVKAITDDVRKNLEKILHHGKRADGIVKGMLQHSRSSSGIKEPTDINVLTDEYLRLAFHGFRAKDKSFNVTTKTDFDESVGKIHVVPQDIGRVVLNLITNAFYAVSEKKRHSGAEYEPTVTLRTERIDGEVLISVIDNGNGISSKVLDKIFQPFFTTKPTGQGTGLGLSLSYDIVKAHAGDLRVETKESEGTEFIIQLPIN